MFLTLILRSFKPTSICFLVGKKSGCLATLSLVLAIQLFQQENKYSSPSFSTTSLKVWYPFNKELCLDEEFCLNDSSTMSLSFLRKSEA